VTLALLLAAAAPAAIALLLAVRSPLRAVALALAPWAAAPALVLALAVPPSPPLSLAWLLLGARFEFDVVGQVFLFFTALLWTAAGVHARAYTAGDDRRRSFFVFFLLTMSGNLLLILARDLASFYMAFALMTFAAYPLVVHRGDAAALRAGRVYIVMAVIGETLLLAGFVSAAVGAGSLDLGDVSRSIAESPHRNAIVPLLLAGFGVKAGALPLHVWLPLAHPVAPTPASAVLSGSMIKAGLLGWLRFLPLGEAALPGWGAVVIGLGLAAAFFGVAIGVTQNDPKTALAYSSISQMGIINIAVGIGLTAPEVWPAALAACLVYVVHHGIGKGALFLGVAVAEASRGVARARGWTLAGLAFAGLSVAGAPLTSGMVAKGYLKDVAPHSPAGWPGMLDTLLPVAAVGTTLLMARFLVLIVRQGEEAEVRPVPPGLWMPWAALVVALAGVAWWVPRRFALGVIPPGVPSAGAIWTAAWPVLAGALLALGALMLARRGWTGGERWHVTAGDVLVPVESLLGRTGRRVPLSELGEIANPVARLSSRWYGIYARPDRLSTLLRLEVAVTRWAIAGTIAVLLLGAMLAALAWR
jgi:formate hydrogenlyase subunit 3/multisubunit Na+/H+ antiporter MnhD subunit